MGASKVGVYDVDGFLEIHIRIGLYGKPTRTDLEQLIPIALEWHKQLESKQGPWVNGGHSRLLFQLDQEQRGGVSYATLAKRINEAVEHYLIEHLAAERMKGPSSQSTPRPEWADDFWPNEYARYHAVALLEDFGLAEIAEDAIEAAVQRLKNGQRAFVGNEDPISRQRLIDVITSWRKRYGEAIQQNLKEVNGNMAHPKTTSSRIAKKASEQLRRSGSTKDQKSVAGSALTQKHRGAKRGK